MDSTPWRIPRETPSISPRSSTLVEAQLEVAGQTVLHGDFDTKARLTVGHLDIAPFLQLFHVTGVTGRSVIGGTLDLAGPAKDPKRFSGKAEIDQFSVTLENIALSSPEPLVISLENGTFSLARARIVGQDTNFEVAATFNLLDDRPLALTGSGSVNMTLAADLRSRHHFVRDTWTSTSTQPGL